MGSSSRRCCAAVLGAGTLIAFSGEGRADVAAARLHLGYEVPAGCPSRKEFVDALESRIQSSWVDRSDRRAFNVRIARLRDGTFSGSLEIRQPEHALAERLIQGIRARR
jgi:hypothetical protein